MKNTKKKHLMFLALLTYLFILNGCVKQEKVSSIKNMETIKVINKPKNTQKESKIVIPEYGQHTDEIEEFLSATPLGSEIYLEQKESGEWYLKIEKTFTAKKHEEKTEMIEPIYGESILI